MLLKGLIRKLFVRRKTLDQIGYLSFEEMERLLNNTVIPLFKKYRAELVKKPPEYLAPAIWGEEESSSLDIIQKEIHRTLAPVCEKILYEIAEHKPDEISSLYTKYLLNGLLLYKMAYMGQCYKNMNST